MEVRDGLLALAETPSNDDALNLFGVGATEDWRAQNSTAILNIEFGSRTERGWVTRVACCIFVAVHDDESSLKARRHAQEANHRVALVESQSSWGK